jgi:uncharacterized protein YkwD
MLITRRHFMGGLTATTLVLPAHAANGYRAYADAMLANPPRGAIIRPDLEQYLDLLAAEARYRARRTPVEGSDLLRDMARAQALEMVKGNFVGHKSASGHSFRARFEAFADPDQRGDFGENAARDRQSGEVDKEKAPPSVPAVDGLCRAQAQHDEPLVPLRLYRRCPGQSPPLCCTDLLGAVMLSSHDG